MLRVKRAQSSTRQLLDLPVNEIVTGENQPRTSFDSYEMQKLTDSIRESGLLQPISVRRCGPSCYELVAGERRLRACIAAGLARIPAIVYDITGEDAAVYALIENIQRSSLSVFDEAEGIKKLITVYGISQSDAAEKLGIAQSTLSNKLRLLRLNGEQRRRIESAGLTERHIRALVRLPESRRDGVLDRVIAEELTVKQTEQIIDKILNKEEEDKPEPYRRAAIGDVRIFANSLSKIVGTMIKAGYKADTRKNETETFVEYTVRIEKQSAQMSLI